MTEFLDFALTVGLALNQDRPLETRCRRAGLAEEANKIYLRNKEVVRVLLTARGMTPEEFDARMAKLSKGVGRRTNVKLARILGGQS